MKADGECYCNLCFKWATGGHITEENALGMSEGHNEHIAPAGVDASVVAAARQRRHTPLGWCYCFNVYIPVRRSPFAYALPPLLHAGGFDVHTSPLGLQ